ncbi:unnamed protein product [Diatraea saccharalis]|uniref:Cdc6 C-terminal domain-containing protein n=1 Tax=Diatraea saccharalis TaxID=40085 RepID=A0A9N9QWA0_9NEOP|nr:unnamed protein product [Diatraea saccharalis]
MFINNLSVLVIKISSNRTTDKMSVLQATIPFKSRKKVTPIIKKNKSNCENDELIGNIQKSPRKRLAEVHADLKGRQQPGQAWASTIFYNRGKNSLSDPRLPWRTPLGVRHCALLTPPPPVRSTVRHFDEAYFLSLTPGANVLVFPLVAPTPRFGPEPWIDHLNRGLQPIVKLAKIDQNLISTLKDDSSSLNLIKKDTISESRDSGKPLSCREKEIDYLENFLDEQLRRKESASIYISGQPGTGKTASLSYILKSPKIVKEYKQVYINCTMMKSAKAIYNRICCELELETSGTTEKACLSAIEKHLKKNHKMILLVLDEIDQLDSKRQSVLYTIFEWPAIHDSGIVLIGIANALDLTERTLPRLQARCSLRPRTLHFAPYTKEQIINIFTTVLAKEDRNNVFSPVALQMLAAKIAAVSGDMRRALDIGRRVIEVARRSKFDENHSIDRMMKDTQVTVELKQVLEVLNDVYGSSRKIETEVEEGFPMQQKLILCSLMLMLTKGKNRDIVMGKLYDVYKRVAVARNIAALDMSEMVGACSLLESSGAVRVVGGGGARSRRLRLQWDESELAAALRDKPLLSTILADVNCLAP